MNRILSAVILGATLITPPLAQASNPLGKEYTSHGNRALSPEEQAALDLAKRWSVGRATGTRPVADTNGTIVFRYGAQRPTIVCAVLQVCDVALQPGEKTNSIHLGDTDRWTVEPAIAGSGPDEIQHLIIQPMEPGLETSLVVATNRRTYHLRLRSHHTQYMLSVAFTYPEARARPEAMQHRTTPHREEPDIPQTSKYLGDLSFNYDVSGSASWKPMRVYNDGQKTILDMPESISQTEAPALMVVRREAGLFHKAETVQIDYRTEGKRYIVDSIFDRAILVAGVGDNRERVTITRRD